MGFLITEVELSEPLRPVQLGAEHEGAALIARWQDRLVGMQFVPFAPGAILDVKQLEALAAGAFAHGVLRAKAEAELERRLPSGDGQAPATITVAICTKDRPVRLRRLLASLTKVTAPDPSVEVLVVDNASSGPDTREAAAGFEGVRYLFEPKPGLDFARNAALREARGAILAFLDDDVVVDRNWLAGLRTAWRSEPGLGGCTGLVLPYRLETPAQVGFERRGGFGRGFERTVFHRARLGNPLHPVGAGVLGAGCNMAFDRQLLLSLGGFDDALDTGAPLPGGGDLDIFYRVLRTGRPMVYEPTYAVYHEHRETLDQLNRQYWSWGLGFMAFLTKCRRTDPQLRGKHAEMLKWWFADKALRVAAAVVRRRFRETRFQAAELWGGVVGLFGEYDRSLARIRKIRERAS